MIIYGKQSCLYAIQRHSEKIQEVFVAKELPKNEFNTLAKLNKKIIKLDNKKAQALAKGGNHQGMLLKLSPLLESSINQIKQYDKLIITCGVSDVGNLGSIIRTAYALGVQGIIFGINNLSDNAKEGIVRASSGAFLDMPFCVYENVLDVANELKNAGFTLIGADIQNSNKKASIKDKWALFLGSESSGLLRRLKSKMDTIAYIQMQNGFECINVAVAAGILIDRINHAK